MQTTVSTQTTAPVLANERGQANILNLMMNADFMACVDKLAALMASAAVGHEPFPRCPKDPPCGRYPGI